MGSAYGSQTGASLSRNGPTLHEHGHRGALVISNSLTMPMQLAATDSTSSDYFEPEDPDFIDALQDTILPGDIPDPQLPTQEQADRESEWAQLAAGQPSLKRSHSVMAEEDSDVPQDMIPENSEVTDEDPTGDTYGASRFGEFGDYMRRKRAKLQIQNAQMSENNNDNASGETESRIFQGIAIYVRFLELSRLSVGC